MHQDEKKAEGEELMQMYPPHPWEGATYIPSPTLIQKNGELE